MKKGYYVVWVGHIPGVYETWEETDEQVNGYSGGRQAGGFATRAEAEKAFAEGYDKWHNSIQNKMKGGPPLF